MCAGFQAGDQAVRLLAKCLTALSQDVIVSESSWPFTAASASGSSRVVGIASSLLLQEGLEKCSREVGQQCVSHHAGQSPLNPDPAVLHAASYEFILVVVKMHDCLISIVYSDQ